MNDINNFKIYVGIDIGKNNHHASIMLSEKSKVLRSFFFSNSMKGFQKLHKNIHKFVLNTIDVKVAMEATAHYYEVLARWLENNNYNLTVCNPRQAKYLRNVLKPYFKTDPIDSLVLAKGAELDLLKGELYDNRYTQLKELLQLDKKLKRDLTRLKNQTTRLMDVIFPERSKIIKGLFGKTSLELLQIVPTPSDIINFGLQNLTKLLKKHSRGRFKLSEAKKLIQLANDSVGISDPIWVYELGLLIPRIQELQKQIEEVEMKIEENAKNEFPSEINRITKITGMGITGAAAIVGFLGDVHRFKGKRVSRKVTAFAGLAVMQYSSGQSERMGKISKAGPSLLRYHLGWAAIHAIKTKGPLKDFYDGLVGRDVSKSKALVAVAAKILRVCFYIIRDGVEYDPDKLQRRGLQKTVKVASIHI